MSINKTPMMNLPAADDKNTDGATVPLYTTVKRGKYNTMSLNVTLCNRNCKVGGQYDSYPLQKAWAQPLDNDGRSLATRPLF